jgi:hypothetical protein
MSSELSYIADSEYQNLRAPYKWDCIHIMALCVIGDIRRLRNVSEGWQVDLIGLRAEPTVLHTPNENAIACANVSVKHRSGTH